MIESKMFFLIDDPIEAIGKNAYGSDCFSVETAFNYLQKVDQLDFTAASVQKSLKKVHSPTTWVFFAGKDNDDLYRADGYDWRDKNDGKKRTHTYHRYYINILVDPESGCTKSKAKLIRKESNVFRKYVYSLNKEIKQGDPILIAYRGDHTVFVEAPHGNATIKTNFQSSLPSVQKVVKDRCNEKKSVEVLFMDIKADLRKEATSPNATGQELVRDRKQIKNYRSKLKNSFIISQDEMTGICLLATRHLENFIRSIHFCPEFYCIMAHPEAIKLANKLFTDCQTISSLEQVVAYDTTFDIGEFYISSVVIKDTDLKDDKIFPVAFFLHNRKDTETHKIFFDWLFNELHIPSQVPFIVDREQSIVNNLLGQCVGADQLFYCTFHIRKNVERWCQANMKVKKTVDSYTRQFRTLINKKTFAEYEETLNSLKPTWDDNFAKYFEKHIEQDILSNLTKATTTDFAYFKNKPQTTNMIESWHFKLQNRYSKYDRIHMRTDVLCLDLYRICTNHMDERNRAIDNDGGEFTLKPIALTRTQRIDLEHLDLTASDILSEIKTLCEEMDGRVDGSENLSEVAIAKIAIKNNLVAYLGMCDSFIVSHPVCPQKIAQVIVKKGIYLKSKLSLLFNLYFSLTGKADEKQYICKCLCRCSTKIQDEICKCIVTNNECFHAIAVKIMCKDEHLIRPMKEENLLLSKRLHINERKGGKKRPKKNAGTPKKKKQALASCDKPIPKLVFGKVLTIVL